MQQNKILSTAKHSLFEYWYLTIHRALLALFFPCCRDATAAAAVGVYETSANVPTSTPVWGELVASSHASMPEKRASTTARRRASAASMGRGERGARSQIPSAPLLFPGTPRSPGPMTAVAEHQHPAPALLGSAGPEGTHPRPSTRRGTSSPTTSPPSGYHACPTRTGCPRPGSAPPKPRDRPEPPPRQRPRPQRPAAGEELGRAGGRWPGCSYPLPRSRGQGPPAEPASETPRAKGRPREFHSRLRPHHCQALPVSSSR